MPDGADAVTIEVLSSIHDVPAAAWDACAGSDDPFTNHAFLAALEDSGSVRAETGWLPRHLAVTAADGTLVGCMPLYLKSHSYGEYVFDWGWAEAYQRAGGRYYPKLQGAVPFTPVTGRRLLLRPDAPAGTFRALATAAVRIAERLGVSSLHITFPTEQEIAALEPHGFLVRLGHRVSLGESRVFQLRRFPCRSRVTQAQGDPQGTAGGRRVRHRTADAQRERASSSGTGMRSIASTSTRLVASGGVLTSTANSFAASARRWPTG